MMITTSMSTITMMNTTMTRSMRNTATTVIITITTIITRKAKPRNTASAPLFIRM